MTGRHRRGRQLRAHAVRRAHERLQFLDATKRGSAFRPQSVVR